MLAFGTDGEHNLHKAFEFFFPNAILLLCDMHMKDNKECSSAVPVLLDIFGKDTGDERQTGLFDAMSSEFDQKLDKVNDVWTKRHVNGLDFFIYFLEEKAPLIKNHMTAEI